MKLIKHFFIVLVLFFATTACAEPVAGKDYQVLNPALPTNSGDKIEVLEFFSYVCIHCYNLNPMLSAWEKKMPKDVSFTYMPVTFNPAWDLATRAFYAAEFLGMQAQLHDVLFDIWHSDTPPYDEESLTATLAKHGVDPKKFHEAFNAFSMQTNLTRAMNMQKDHRIMSTPTIIVDGKYAISGESAHAVQILDALIIKARKERKH